MFGILGNKISSLFSKKNIINEEMLERLEELLITSDISFDIVTEIIEDLKKIKTKEELTETEIKEILKNKFIQILKPCETTLNIEEVKPFSLVMVGVNGCGKTSTIGKLVNTWKGKKISVIACDTFRLSATEQLKELVNIPDINFIEKQNADPSGLVYDGYNKAKSLNSDIVIIDTAGRLGNNSNLMGELKKIIKTIGKIDNNAPSKTILVLDGNGGQNSLLQMERFNEQIKIDGIIITKTEGSAKSGFVLSLANKFKTPIFFTTYGEKLSDIKEFKAEDFINKLLS